MKTEKIGKQHKTQDYRALFRKQLTDPISGKIYICPISLDCGCTYDRYSLCSKVLVDDNLFFKCGMCGKLHSKSVLSRIKINKQLKNIIDIYVPSNVLKQIPCNSGNTFEKHKMVDRLKKIDWIGRLEKILEIMNTKKTNSVKYTSDDVNKYLTRWAHTYLSDFSIKEYADEFMKKKGIDLDILVEDSKIITVEIKCK